MNTLDKNGDSVSLSKRDIGFLNLLGQGDYSGASRVLPEQRDKLRKLADFLEVVFFLIKSCYAYLKKRRNNAGKAAIATVASALQGKFPDMRLDFSKIRILSGALAAPSAAMHREDDSDLLSFAWEVSTQRNSNRSDELMVIMYCPKTKEFWCEHELGITRADEYCTIVAPAQFAGKEVQIWLAYRSADGHHHSNSSYMGKVFIPKTTSYEKLEE